MQPTQKCLVASTKHSPLHRGHPLLSTTKPLQVLATATREYTGSVEWKVVFDSLPTTHARSNETVLPPTSIPTPPESSMRDRTPRSPAAELPSKKRTDMAHETGTGSSAAARGLTKTAVVDVSTADKAGPSKPKKGVKGKESRKRKKKSRDMISDTDSDGPGPEHENDVDEKDVEDEPPVEGTEWIQRVRKQDADYIHKAMRTEGPDRCSTCIRKNLPKCWTINGYKCTECYEKKIGCDRPVIHPRPLGKRVIRYETNDTGTSFCCIPTILT